jgi:hypothetical protein
MWWSRAQLTNTKSRFHKLDVMRYKLTVRQKTHLEAGRQLARQACRHSFGLKSDLFFYFLNFINFL